MVLMFIFVVSGALLCVRLGFWQLDRLEQKRKFINHYSAIANLPPLAIDKSIDYKTLIDMDYRKIIITGKFDNENNFVLRNQYHDGIPGYFLITPLKISDNLGILIERGWIPAEGNASSENWHQYDNFEVLKFAGTLRIGNIPPEIGQMKKPVSQTIIENQLFVNDINTESIGLLLPYKLLPFFIQPDSPTENINPPIPFHPEIDVSEGPHFGYALQWFTFASILVFGYPFFLKKQISDWRNDEKVMEEND